MDGIDSKDALFAVSLSPYANPTHRTAKLGRAVGAAVVAVTDSESSPIAGIANVAILRVGAIAIVLRHHLSGLTAAEILVALLASRAGPDVPKKVGSTSVTFRPPAFSGAAENGARAVPSFVVAKWE
jgi:DNA-binding MurR/RpiR family transcriptional regulator